jgi:hypothetical protein
MACFVKPMPKSTDRDDGGPRCRHRWRRLVADEGVGLPPELRRPGHRDPRKSSDIGNKIPRAQHVGH